MKNLLSWAVLAYTMFIKFNTSSFDFFLFIFFKSDFNWQRERKLANNAMSTATLWDYV